MLSGRDEYGYYTDGLNSLWMEGPNALSGSKKHNKSKPNELCKRFKAGTCPCGDQCRYVHDAVSCALVNLTSPARYACEVLYAWTCWSAPYGALLRLVGQVAR